MKILTKKNMTRDEKILILGNFDGIHKGHQKLIKMALGLAKDTGYKSAIFTFDCHPSYVLANSEPVPLIHTKYEKQKTLDKQGVDYYIEYPFTTEFAGINPENFVENILVNEMKGKIVIVGTDYKFGAKGKGDIHLLKEMAEEYGFGLLALDKVKIEGREISSSWIREELTRGNIEKANDLLGREYFFIGQVVKGEQIGRTIGFPTANIIPSGNKILPPNGVYKAIVEIDGVQYKGLTNIGKKPTVSGRCITIETYIFDFSEMIYGKEIKVGLSEFLREEFKFSNLGELKEQIRLDVEACANGSVY